MGGEFKKKNTQTPYSVSQQAWNMQGALAQEAQRRFAARNTAPQADAHDEQADAEIVDMMDTGPDTEQADAEIVDMDNAPYRESTLEESLRDLRGAKKGGLKGYLGIGGDSDKFKAVVDATQTAVDLMKGPVGPTRKEARENLIKGLAACARLAAACQKYNARTARTEAGLARQKKVGLIQELAEKDLPGIRATLDQIDMIPNNELSEMTWNKVRERSRMLEIHVDSLDSLETTGGQSSTVYKLGKAGFFKEEETLSTKHADAFRSGTKEEGVNSLYSAQQLDLKDTLRMRAPAVAKKMKLSVAAKEYIEGKEYNVDEIPQGDALLKEVKSDSVAEEVTAFCKAMQDENKSRVRGWGVTLDNVTHQQHTRGIFGKGTYNVSRRNVAVSRVAELLGVGNLIAKSQTARIIDSKGREMTGNLMAGARGKSAMTISTEYAQQQAEEYFKKKDVKDASMGDFYAGVKEMGSDPKLQKMLSSLQVLDNLCGLQDRHGENFFVETDDNGMATSVQGIDNDYSFGAVVLDRQKEADKKFGGARHGLNHTADVVQYGKITLPHIDKQLAQNILDLDDATARYALSDLITEEEIDAFLARLHDLQKAFRSEMKNKESTVFIEDDSGWNDQTHQDFMNVSRGALLKRKTQEVLDRVAPFPKPDQVAPEKKSEVERMFKDCQTDEQRKAKWESKTMFSRARIVLGDKRADALLDGVVEGDNYYSRRRIEGGRDYIEAGDSFFYSKHIETAGVYEAMETKEKKKAREQKQAQQKA